MPKRDNTARLADKYQLSDLEPDVDPKKVAAFLGAEVENKRKPVRRRSGVEHSTAQLDPKPVAVPPALPQLAQRRLLGNEEVWTSRTVRVRQSTATRLTKAVCSQKMKQAEGKLNPGEPVTVQEIADHGIRLALAELGYEK